MVLGKSKAWLYKISSNVYPIVTCHNRGFLPEIPYLLFKQRYKLAFTEARGSIDGRHH